jgi:cation diffusion facilitator CzcD-associated flavoprotein CzcO
MSAVPVHHDVIVIGAGFGGIGMGIALKRAGREDFLILEQNVGVGGTWHANRYPGAACDIPSLLYSFSFAPARGWSRRYPQQAEIESYLDECIGRFDIGGQLRLRTRVTDLAWDESRQHWIVRAEQGGAVPLQWTARVVVSATGGLSRPAIPKLPGLSDFKGPVMHTARWRGEVAVAGKRVGVVGTGASAIQVVPQLVKTAATLTLFQRSPAWIFPKPDKPFGPVARFLQQQVPAWSTLQRAILYATHEMRGPGFTRRPEMLKLLEPMAIRFMHHQVRDPALRLALTPSYRMGCKRILLASDFYPALQRRNSHLVTAAIEQVLPEGIRSADGAFHPLDVLVLATGFQAADAMAPFPIRGRRGIELGSVWRDAAHAYLGSTVPGFPNLFMIVGPNTGLGHNSMVYMIESQIRYVMDALARMERAGLGAVDAKWDVVERFNNELQQRMQATVWATGGCTSWYRARSGRITTLWPGSSWEFRRRTRRFELADYEGLRP